MYAHILIPARAGPPRRRPAPGGVPLETEIRLASAGHRDEFTRDLSKTVAELDALRARLKAVVYDLFPQTTETPYSGCAAKENKPADAQGA
ncbi:MAG: hypothetical protein ACHQ50_09065 [Fimbriimonadales bacterium]